MATEISLLGAMIEDRSVYETFTRFGDEGLFGGLGKSLFIAIRGFYETDGNIQSACRDTLRERVYRELPNPKHQRAFDEFLGGIGVGISATNVERDIRDLRRDQIGGELSLALANRERKERIDGLIAEYRSLDDGYSNNAGTSQSELIDVLDTKDLLEEKSDVDYIHLWPKALNDKLDGGCSLGHHVLIFARPEQGKTAFAVNLVAGFLKQGLHVLYVGNEEPGADIRDRIRGRLLKVSRNQVRADRGASVVGLMQAAQASARIAAKTDFHSVRSLLASLEYSVVVFDQLRNMKVKSDSRTAELEAAGIEARAIAKEFKVLVVSITQAGDSATGKAYLEMSDVDSSKTGIPASADLMIGLGSTPDMKAQGLLGVSLCKNKLSGEHSRFTVQCNFSTGVIV